MSGVEILDNGTRVLTAPRAAFGTDALLLGRFAQPRRAERALDMCSGCGIISLLWHDAGHRGPCTAVELDADASALCRRAVQETPGAEHITALCTDLRTFCKSGPEQGKYDFAACNPPYFTGGYVSPDARRATARHGGRPRSTRSPKPPFTRAARPTLRPSAPPPSIPRHMATCRPSTR